MNERNYTQEILAYLARNVAKTTYEISEVLHIPLRTVKTICWRHKDIVAMFSKQGRYKLYTYRNYLLEKDLIINRLMLENQELKKKLEIRTEAPGKENSHHKSSDALQYQE